MSSPRQSRLPQFFREHQRELLVDWIREQSATEFAHNRSAKQEELSEEGAEFLQLFVQAIQEGAFADTKTAPWAPVREMLAEVSRSRSRLGINPSETATFVFSLKKPVFARLRQEVKSAEELSEEIWLATEILDSLGLYTTEVHQKTRDEIIMRQQQEMMELSTPVVKLWDGILALPLIGTLDSARTQVVMETLLQRIVETGSRVAIIDITGVPTVDTLVAQHLLKAVTAARLMGADCIISGIRPQIAQTIVHLGVTLNVTTKASLADAFQLALQSSGLGLSRLAPAQVSERAR